MKKPTILLTAIAAAIALTACGEADRTTSIPSGVDLVATYQGEPSGPSAPPAPAERGPIPPNANTAAPGTDAEAAFAGKPNNAKSADDTSNDARIATRAEDAAARAPDTASGDAAKKAIYEGKSADAAPAAPSQTARDTEENAPRHGTITRQQDVHQLPKAGQVNNHSSTALEKDSGR